MIRTQVRCDKRVSFRDRREGWTCVCPSPGVAGEYLRPTDSVLPSVTSSLGESRPSKGIYSAQPNYWYTPVSLTERNGTKKWSGRPQSTRELLTHRHTKCHRSFQAGTRYAACRHPPQNDFRLSATLFWWVTPLGKGPDRVAEVPIGLETAAAPRLR